MHLTTDLDMKYIVNNYFERDYRFILVNGRNDIGMFMNNLDCIGKFWFVKVVFKFTNCLISKKSMQKITEEEFCNYH